MEAVLIDKMGTDLSVVNSARVSFSKESEWEDGQWTNIRPDIFDDDNTPYRTEGKGYYTLKLSDADQKLIKYLARNNHWTPFSHVQITIRERVPIFVARQRFKHMVGFTYNEVSRRYVSEEPSFYVPDVWRGAPKNAKQGSSDEVITGLDWYFDSDIKPSHNGPNIKKAYLEHLESSERLYTVMIGNGVAPEQARMVLPQSMYTEYYVTGSLAAWARAYKLRIDPHAQKEIQDLAREWNTIISGLGDLEHSWKALTE